MKRTKGQEWSARVGMTFLLVFWIWGSFVVGCTNWEQTTYKTLAASQAVINQAQADYEASATASCAPTATACLPHSTAVYNTVNEAKKIQTTAVDSMVTYEEAKAAGGTTASLTALEADVNVAIQQLPTIITDIKALYTKGGN